MKKKIMIIFVIIIVLIGISFYLFIPIFKFSKDIYISYNTEFDISKYSAFLKGKNIKVYTNNDIDTTILSNVKIIMYTKEKFILNRKKEVTLHIVDDIKPELTLNGENEIILNINEEYKELGATSIDNYDNDITNNIEITNNIDNKNIGEYKVTYKVKDSNNNENLITRKIIVKDTDGPKITLNRKINSYVILGNSIDLNEFKAIDNLDGDVTDKVSIDGTVDTNKEGIYKVTYKVKDSSDNETILETTINVQNKNTSGIAVLMYHWFYDDTKGETYGKTNDHNYVSKTNFDTQVKYLVDNNYYFPDYNELNDYIDGKIELPKKSVILTSDDSVESFFKVAGEVLKKYKVPMTSFVITKSNYWKNYTDNEYINFQSHTDMLHTRSCNKSWDGAAMCASYDEILKDLQTTNDKLTALTNTNIDAIAYPFGHYSDDFIKAIKKVNIKLAFTINKGKVKKGSNKYKLPRVRVSRTTNMTEFTSRL